MGDVYRETTEEFLRAKAEAAAAQARAEHAGAKLLALMERRDEKSVSVVGLGRVQYVPASTSKRVDIDRAVEKLTELGVEVPMTELERRASLRVTLNI